MDVNSVMSTYNLNSLWNSVNPNNTSTSTVPMVSNIDSTVKDKYTSDSYFGKSAASQLQNIYQSIEPNYGSSLTYDEKGNMAFPTATTLPASGEGTEDSNIISLLNSSNSASDNCFSNILSQYNSIENATFKTDESSILSSNSIGLYSYVSSLSDNGTESSGNSMDTII